MKMRNNNLEPETLSTKSRTERIGRGINKSVFSRYNSNKAVKKDESDDSVYLEFSTTKGLDFQTSHHHL